MVEWHDNPINSIKPIYNFVSIHLIPTKNASAIINGLEHVLTIGKTITIITYKQKIISKLIIQLMDDTKKIIDVTLSHVNYQKMGKMLRIL